MTFSQITRSRVSILTALTISLFFILLNSGLPTPLYPLYKEKFFLNNTDLTLIFSSYGFGVLLALFLSRALSINEENARRWLVASLFVVAVPALGFSFARSLVELCASRFISGLGAGTATAIINILLMHFSYGDSAKRAAQLASLALVTGLGLGPMIGSIYSQLAFYPLIAPGATIAALVLVSACSIVKFWPKAASVSRAETVAKAVTNHLGFNKPLFYLLALCVFLSWSYAALILSLGPMAAIAVFGLKSPAYFGYIVTSYLLLAGVVQFSLPRILRPEYSLLTGLAVQIVAMMIMIFALENGSIFIALLSLTLSGFSYGAVFVGGAILVNKISLAAPGWNAVTRFYFIVYLFNITPLIAGWMADSISIFHALIAAISFFTAAYVLFLAWATCALLPADTRG